MKLNLIVFTILLLSISIKAFNFEGERIKTTEPQTQADESQYEKPDIKAAVAPKKADEQYEETTIISKDSKKEESKATSKKEELKATETPEIKKAQGQMESTTIENQLGEEQQNKKSLEEPEMVRMNQVHAGKTALKRSKFGSYLMKQTAKRPYVSGYIDTYLQDGYSYRYEEKYSYSANYAYLPSQYGPWVQTIIQDVCICRWPLPIRYLVFPRIYGFYEDEKLMMWLEELYAMGDPEAIVETMMSGLTPEEEEMRNDLIEQLASYQHIKSMVDENLTEQSSQILEAEKLKDSIDEEFGDILEQYQDLIGDDEFLADEELGIDDIIDFLKEQVKDGEKSSDKKDKDDDTDWKKKRQQKAKAAMQRRKERRHKRHARKAAQKKLAMKMKLANLKKEKEQRDAHRLAKSKNESESQAKKAEMKHESKKAESKHESKKAESKHESKKTENKHEKKVEIHAHAATLLHEKKN